LHTYKKGRAIIEIGEMNESLYILKEGSVQIMYNGKPFETWAPGDFFGEIPFVVGIPNLFQVIASAKSKVYHIPYRILEGIPIIHWRLFSLSEKWMTAFTSRLLHDITMDT